MTKSEFKISPTCPNPDTCTWLGFCFARQLLEHELKTRVPSEPGVSLPPQHDAVESLMRAAKCTDSGFIGTLWRALEFLILNPRK
ncbi:hypothetical protein KBD69_00390 [Candidatus Woesebacteria bacterium]|nr:hypothetical protein [Candidatus Woesebacteria bacterium]